MGLRVTDNNGFRIGFICTSITITLLIAINYNSS
jgi:hypothetical protein